MAREKHRSFFPKALILAPLALFLFSCTDLAVFIPAFLANPVVQLKATEIDEEGYLHLNWQTKENKAPRFDIFKLEIQGYHPLYHFSEKSSPEAPLVSELIQVRDLDETPKVKGVWLTTVSDPSFISSELLIPNRLYAIQIVQKDRLFSPGPQKILLISSEFEAVSGASAILENGKAKLHWNPVPGANRYEIYADEEMTVPLGDVRSNNFTCGESVPLLKEYFIRPLRGQFGSLRATRVVLKQADDSPTILKVTSGVNDGSYKAGSVLPISVTFSTNVFVTRPSGVSLALETVPLRAATYVSGSGSPTLIFNYTVQRGDASDDLEYKNIAALTLGGGSIKDSKGQNAILTLPLLFSANSLGGSKAIVIDTSAPPVPIFTNPTDNTTVMAPLSTLSGTSEAKATVKIYENSVTIGTVTADSSGAWTLTLASPYPIGAYDFDATATDAAGNESDRSAPVHVLVVRPPPTVDAGQDVFTSVNSSTVIGLATDADSYQWTVVSGPGIVIFASETTPSSPLTFSAVGRYVLRLTVTNSVGMASDDVTYVFDNTAPTLGDIQYRQTDSSAGQVFWSAALDDISPSQSIRYALCYSPIPTTCSTDFDAHKVDIPNNVFEYDLTLDPSFQQYEIILRAMDETGNASYSPVQYTSKRQNFFQIDVGHEFACALLESEKVMCWGRNDRYQLGSGGSSTASSEVPKLVVGLSGVKRLAVGLYHACALLADGTVKCWGFNNHGQLGDGSTTDRSTPVLVSGLGNVMDITAGESFTCALLSDKTVRCWGDNASGQLGDGSTVSSSTPSSISSTDLSDVSMISAGYQSVCAIFGTNDDLKCWGRNHRGQLGLGNTTNSSLPLPVNGMSHLKAVSAGEAYTCAVKLNGDAYCWGYNQDGELGDGTTMDTDVPGSSFLSGVSALATGHWNTCALMNDATAKCWGNNSAGQLGSGDFTGFTSPQTVLGLSGIAELSLGGPDVNTSVCARLNDKTITCWGSDSQGQLGDGNLKEITNPVKVSLLSSNAVGLGTGIDHSCALLSDKSIECWGDNWFGQLGAGLPMGIENLVYDKPQKILGISNAEKITLGSYHTCALLEDTTVKCWGFNDYGQLGIGNTDDQNTPQTVLAGAVDIAAGEAHTCAVMLDGSMKCWGIQDYGTLGNGMTSSQALLPTDATLFGNGIHKIALGYDHTCVLYGDATVKCVGGNDLWQLGDGTDIDSSTPVNTDLGAAALDITSFRDHSCALMVDKTVKCWGYNQTGALGIGNSTDQSTAQTAVGLNSVKQVSTGKDFSCAVFDNGKAKCWGSNEYHQVSAGSNAQEDTPIDVNGLGDITSISTGFGHACAILTDKSVRCWGYNNKNQSGVPRASVNKRFAGDIVLFPNEDP